MPTICPLELPEILLYITHYLDARHFLTYMQVSRVWHAVFSRTLWRSVHIDNKEPPPEGLQRYRHLIRHLSLSKHDFTTHFAIHYPYLQSLTLHSSFEHAETVIRLNPTITNINIKYYSGLSMDGKAVWREQLRLITACTHLKQLIWHLTEDTLPLVEFTEQVQDYMWPDFEELSLSSNVQSTSEQALADTITKIPRLKSFQGSKMAFGPICLKALASHAKWIKKLDLLDCSLVKGGMVQTILETCSLLEELLAPRDPESHMLAEDVLGQNARPWRCGSLRKLVVGFRLTGKHREVRKQSRKIFTRLAKLQSLKVLELHGPEVTEDTEVKGQLIVRPLMFKMEFGLKQLSSLTDLTELLVPHKLRVLDRVDFDWMVECWPRLVFLSDKHLRQDPMNPTPTNTVQLFTAICSISHIIKMV